MNWILLIIGGLFEVGFATCLGKAKESTGMTSNLMDGRILSLLGNKHGLALQSYSNITHWDSLCGLDGNWGSRNCSGWDFRV
jgi:hypothetical protein